VVASFAEVLGGQSPHSEVVVDVFQISTGELLDTDAINSGMGIPKEALGYLIILAGEKI